MGFNAIKFDLDTPWDKLPKAAKDLILYGSEGKEFTMKWGEGHRWRRRTRHDGAEVVESPRDDFSRIGVVVHDEHVKAAKIETN